MTLRLRRSSCPGPGSTRRPTFDDVGKSGVSRRVVVADPGAYAVVAAPARRTSPDGQLFGWPSGRRWHDVTAADVDEYLHERLGEATAEDFRGALRRGAHDRARSPPERASTTWTRRSRAASRPASSAPSCASWPEPEPGPGTRCDVSRCVDHKCQ
jgi:hypothetical protein